MEQTVDYCIEKKRGAKKTKQSSDLKRIVRTVTVYRKYGARGCEKIFVRSSQFQVNDLLQPSYFRLSSKHNA